MPKQLILNAFENFGPGFMNPGQWTNPIDRSFAYNSIDHWATLAKTLERGCFDSLFFLDSVGVFDVYQGSADAAIRTALLTPLNDPLLLIPAMAQVTEHLGFGVTVNLSCELPYLLARRMSTLDHLTNGRIGWNIVTGFVDSAARALGQSSQLDHDKRYDAADEFMEIVYRLWEASWEEGAVLRDRENRIYADPAKVHKVHFEGEYFQMDGIHRCEPSPQRTPVLFQAGASDRGKTFGAKHCECIYAAEGSKAKQRALTNDIRKRTEDNGRDPAGIKILGNALVIVGETEADAARKLEEHQRYHFFEGSLIMGSAGTGKDLSKSDLDAPFGGLKGQSAHGIANSWSNKDEEVLTPRKVSNHLIGARGALIVGTPSQVADEMESWVEEGGLDGFNLNPGLRFRTTEDFVDLMVPELQRRGIHKSSYQQGTLREKLNGKPGAYLEAPHPAAALRR